MEYRFFSLSPKTVNSSTATVCMIVIMLPLFLLVMYERHGQPLEVVAGQIIQTVFIRPKERSYQTYVCPRCGCRVQQARDRRACLRADGLGPGLEPLPAPRDFMFLWFLQRASRPRRVIGRRCREDENGRQPRCRRRTRRHIPRLVSRPGSSRADPWGTEWVHMLDSDVVIRGHLGLPPPAGAECVFSQVGVSVSGW